MKITLSLIIEQILLRYQNNFVPVDVVAISVLSHLKRPFQYTVFGFSLSYCPQEHSMLQDPRIRCFMRNNTRGLRMRATFCAITQPVSALYDVVK